ncbi:MAG: nucleotide exchange factor GrpE [Candidatus Omnitrophota bacterium]
MKKDHPHSSEHKEGTSAKEPVKTEDVVLKQEEHRKLLARIEELEAMKDKMLRTAADYENAKKRLLRERDEFVKFAQENLLREMLPVLDNFERALSHAGEGEDPKVKALVAGIQMVCKQMTEIFRNQGLQRIETVGKPFDPHWHEAVSYQQEEGEEEIILDEIQAGYTLHGKLLRAAKVRVRMRPASSSTENSPAEDKDDEIT